ncbi:MAG: DUF368 domain-containing protein [Chitinispirillaceae bacterium]
MWLKETVTGFLIGLANIIPGVSGGTFLLVFGLYERVMNALNRINAANIREGLGHAVSFTRSPDKKSSFVQLGDYLKKMDLLFLGRLAFGAIVAILIMSGLMKMLLNDFFSYTYAFFFGLILVSIAIPWRHIRNKHFAHLFFLLIGAALTVYVASEVNPVDKTLAKSERYKDRIVSEQTQADEPAGNSAQNPQAIRYSTAEYASIGLAGAIAISAMVLPGISGSLVLILMGQYYEVISAISSLRHPQLEPIVFLAMFGLGMVIGLFLFARLVSWVLARYHDQTMAFLLGLLAGSLYALWPFKQAVTTDLWIKASNGIRLMEDAVVYTNINTLPDSAATGVWVAFCAIAGAGIMFFFARKEAA